MAETRKKLDVVQLTFIVTGSIMGSGTSMRLASMAQLGAIRSKGRS